jgi:hypothetical protein
MDTEFTNRCGFWHNNLQRHLLRWLIDINSSHPRGPGGSPTTSIHSLPISVDGSSLETPRHPDPLSFTACSPSRNPDGASFRLCPQSDHLHSECRHGLSLDHLSPAGLWAPWPLLKWHATSLLKTCVLVMITNASCHNNLKIPLALHDKHLFPDHIEAFGP